MKTRPLTAGEPRVPDAAGVPASVAVRERRRVVGLTRQRLADAVAVSRQTVVWMENGDYAPSVYLALAIARTLRTAVEDLWGGGQDDAARPPLRTAPGCAGGPGGR